MTDAGRIDQILIGYCREGHRLFDLAVHFEVALASDDARSLASHLRIRWPERATEVTLPVGYLTVSRTDALAIKPSVQLDAPTRQALRTSFEQSGDRDHFARVLRQREDRDLQAAIQEELLIALGREPTPEEAQQRLVDARRERAETQLVVLGERELAGRSTQSHQGWNLDECRVAGYEVVRKRELQRWAQDRGREPTPADLRRELDRRYTAGHLRHDHELTLRWPNPHRDPIAVECQCRRSLLVHDAWLCDQLSVHSPDSHAAPGRRTVNIEPGQEWPRPGEHCLRSEEDPPDTHHSCSRWGSAEPGH